MSNSTVTRKQAPPQFIVPQEKADEPLRECVREALKDYFAHLHDHEPSDLYQLVLEEVEPAVFSTVLDYARGNQSRAAAILGISRSTLRKKLASYKIR
ncbi:MAG: helix-turn-helix domain-containing protein [Pseudomonadota bacterium]